jgi:hypothetical protein
MLTQGCLQRHFVRLEINAAAKFGIPTIMVQETDPRHGSVPLLEHHNDCPAGATREHLFGEQAHEVILWYRALHYKFTGARQIAQQLLAVDSASLPDIVFPGEVAQRTVKLPPLDNVRSKHFYLLACAPWCAKLKHTLESGLPELVIELAEPGTFVKKQSIKKGAEKVRNNMVRRASAVMQNIYLQAKEYKNVMVNHQKKKYAKSLPACAMLVPLHKDTLLNPGVQDDLFEAIHANMEIVLLHIQEEECGAVPFATFFEQCPDNLRDAGLFDKLACTWHFQEPYCTVATKLLALKLEATRASAGSRGWKAVIGEAAGTIKNGIKKNMSRTVDTNKNTSRAVVPTDDGPAENDKLDMETGDAPEHTPVQAIKHPLQGGTASAALPAAINPTTVDEGDFGEL